MPFYLLFSLHTALRIGFVEEPYEGYERDGFATVVVQVFGSLGREVIVRLYSEDLTPAQAVGE